MSGLEAFICHLKKNEIVSTHMDTLNAHKAMDLLNLKKNAPFFSRASVIITCSALLLLAGCGDKSTEADQKESVALKDLVERSTKALAEKNDALAISLLEKLITQHAESPVAQEYKLKLAKMYTELEQYESAYRLYKDYAQLYPSDAHAEFAFYQALLAKYYQTIKMRVECDSSEALKTIKLCDKYLAHPNFAVYRSDVVDIKKTCNTRIVNKEIYVFNNNILQGKLMSARTRLECFKEEFLPNNPDLEPEIMFLECKLAHAEEDAARKDELYKILQEKYPQSSFTKMARGLVKTGLFA